ncbi:DNA-directed RNA polymerase III subunit RPC9-like [Gigantopelta aegis]|uniref:DNA-directed RNA polymerase III subunit RPC9-like n=1 Tax=Gigantopelta aegis TaxID=1735272 RepID=UPI001B88A1C2|nr:DNA-directed RNA polymerase III subunit RPC9-like [Gigantopelta aegis]
MEVKNENAALLSNYEVFSLMTDIQAGRGQRKPNKHQQNLATVVYETVKYLQDTPCKVQSETGIQEFMKDMAPYKLTKAEKLQLLNHRPTTAVEIQVMIEESEERLTEEQIYEVLDIIAKHLPDQNETDMEQGAEETVPGETDS